MAISVMKDRHRQELAPEEAKRRELKHQLGVLYSGINIGDILEDAKGRKVLVTSVFATWHGSWETRGQNILKDGSRGEFREVHNYQGFRKIADQGTRESDNA